MVLSPAKTSILPIHVLLASRDLDLCLANGGHFSLVSRIDCHQVNTPNLTVSISHLTSFLQSNRFPSKIRQRNGACTDYICCPIQGNVPHCLSVMERVQWENLKKLPWQILEVGTLFLSWNLTFLLVAESSIQGSLKNHAISADPNWPCIS